MDDHHEYHVSTGLITPGSFTMSPGSLSANEVCANPQAIFSQQSCGWVDGFQACHDRHSISAPAYRPFNGQLKQEDTIRHHSLGGSQTTWPCEGYSYTSNQPSSPHLAFHDECSSGRGGRYSVSESFIDDTSGGVSSSSSSSDRNWISMANDTDEQCVRQSLSLNQSVHSPSEVLRPDGVRKKNAKFEIPQERTIDNIDFLLKREKDDEKRRELKMQKRLLKNREAALQSRQRKKKHTENLEEEKRDFLNAITKLQEEVRRLSIQVDSHQQEKLELTRMREESEARVQGLESEKRQLIESHKHETAELQGRITMLQESMATAESSPITAPSSDGYVDFATEMEKVSLGGSQWDSFELIDEMCFEPEQSFSARPHSSSSAASVNALHITQGSTDDLAVDSRVSTMLYLYGAYIAANTPAGESSVIPPPLPDDVRAASSLLMDKVLAQTNPLGIVSQQQNPSRETQNQCVRKLIAGGITAEVVSHKNTRRPLGNYVPLKPMPVQQVGDGQYHGVAEFKKILEQAQAL